MARIAGVKREESEAKILRSAIYCLANFGDKETTFRTIASHAGVSPALVGIYFKCRDELFPKVLEFVIHEARTETAQAVEKFEDPTQKLKAYFKVSIEFFRSTPERAKIYLYLYHLASLDERYRKTCTEIKDIAVKRIERILDDGLKAGQFRYRNRTLAARTIHDGVIGLLLSIMTTEQQFPDSVLIQSFEEAVLTSIHSDM